VASHAAELEALTGAVAHASASIAALCDGVLTHHYRDVAPGVRADVITALGALMAAALFDRLPVCLFLLSKGADLMAATNINWTALTHYGQYAQPPVSPATLAERRTALEEAWRAGPHPSQVQRRRDEAWDRRKSLMQVSSENGYRPLAHRVAAMPAVDPAAAIPAIPLDNAEQRHAHLLGQVLSNEGIHRNIVSML
jgi:hypothetical protein